MVVYQLLLHLMLYKLVIAVAYTSYRTYTRNQLMRSLQKRNGAIRMLFGILSGNRQRVTRAAWRRVAMYPHRSRPLNQVDCEILWQVAVGSAERTVGLSKVSELKRRPSRLFARCVLTLRFVIRHRAVHSTVQHHGRQRAAHSPAGAVNEARLGTVHVAGRRTRVVEHQARRVRLGTCSTTSTLPCVACAD